MSTKNHSNRGALGALRSLWRALESAGGQRASAHMQVIADRYRHSRPELARLLRRAAARRAAA